MKELSIFLSFGMYPEILSSLSVICFIIMCFFGDSILKDSDNKTLAWIGIAIIVTYLVLSSVYIFPN